MTTTEQTTTDPRAAFGSAVGVALDVVRALPAGALDRPTPCADFDVRTLRGHVLTVLLRTAHVGRGGAPLDVPRVSQVAEDDVPTAFAAAVGRDLDVDPAVAEVGAAASRAMLPPGQRPPGFPFGAEVPAPEGATPLERLVAWQGRDPRWRP